MDILPLIGLLLIGFFLITVPEIIKFLVKVLIASIIAIILIKSTTNENE